MKAGNIGFGAMQAGPLPFQSDGKAGQFSREHETDGAEYSQYENQEQTKFASQRWHGKGNSRRAGEP
jgi:hypothetical protein